MSIAPVRERGLKFEFQLAFIRAVHRSRKGAWIEINIMSDTRLKNVSLP